MKILITGGLGYIGSKLIERLLKKDNQIDIIDNKSTNISKEITGCKIIIADITNFEDLKKKITKNYDLVLHLAAQSSGPKSFEDPELDIKVNILGTVNIIQLCNLNKIPKIIFASTFTVYGDHVDINNYNENLPCKPKSLYGVAKLAAENYIKIFGEKYNIKWNIMRMFNVYGPGQDLSRKDQGLVSIFLSYVLEGNHIPVHGSLERFRDVVFIDDVIDAWELCIYGNVDNEVFNVGTGKKTMFKDLINKIIKLYNKDVSVKVTGSTPGDMMGCIADISKIKQMLNYEPKHELEDGLKKFKEYLDATINN